MPNLRNLPSKVFDAVQLILADCEKSGFKVIFQNKVFIKYNKTYYSGIFLCSDKEIRLATKCHWEEWVATLIHEYCHFLQFREGSSFWKAAEDNVFAEWVEGELEIPWKDVKQQYKAIRDLELDCELRVEKFIKKYDIPLCLKEHRQWINYHMCSYAMMLVTRKPMKSTVPTEILIRTLPKNRLLTKWEFNNPPKRFQELYYQYNM